MCMMGRQRLIADKSLYRSTLRVEENFLELICKILFKHNQLNWSLAQVHCIVNVFLILNVIRDSDMKVQSLILEIFPRKVSGVSRLVGTIFTSIIILLLWSYSHQCQLVVFHWNLSKSRSPQISRTLLSILADFESAVVKIFPLISLSLLLTRPLGTVPSATTTTGITVTFYKFFSHPFFYFYSMFSWNNKIQ